MAKGKGRGWWGEPKRHADAARGKKTTKLQKPQTSLERLQFLGSMLWYDKGYLDPVRRKAIKQEMVDIQRVIGEYRWDSGGQLRKVLPGQQGLFMDERMFRRGKWDVDKKIPQKIPQKFRQPPGYGTGKTATIPEMDSWVYEAMKYRGQIRDPKLRTEFDQYLDGYDIEENYGGKAALVNAMGEILDMSAEGKHA